MDWNVLELVWSYFTHFDSFNFGLISALSLLLFLFAFSYAAYRGREENPMQLAAEVSIYTMVFALVLDFMHIPSLIVGFVIILAYELLSRHFCKTRFRVWIEGFIALWLFLIIFALVGDYVRPIMGVIGLVIFFAMSEVRMREKQKEEEKEKSKK